VSPQLTIVLVGACAAVACALPGTLLVLRGMSLLGDAISHAVLPGIVIAFLVTNSATALPVVVGASVLGLATVFLIEALHRTRRVKEDASIAVVFPALFAVGVLLVARYTGQKDLDQECVLYGEIAFAPDDTMRLFGALVSRPLVVLASIAVLNLVFVLALYKELKLATFDPPLAAALGISPVLVHYLLMGTVSVTTVACFESIGAILVVAFLIVPAATAYLWTDRLGLMLVLASAIGAACATGGYYVARAIDGSVAGCMAATMGAAFAATWLVAPREGVLARLLRASRRKERFARALVLERLGRAGGAREDELADGLRWAPERVRTVLDALAGAGLAARDGDAFSATPEGRAYVAAVVGP